MNISIRQYLWWIWGQTPRFKDVRPKQKKMLEKYQFLDISVIDH